MSWGTRRRNSILGIIFLIIAIPASIILFNIYYEPANCFDGAQNGGERGIDCGGSCELLCRDLVLDLQIQWRRYFEVAPGTYNVVAMVENPNPDAGVAMVPYSFKLYDDSNVLLYERKGVTHIRPKEVIPIIENTLFTDQLQAGRMTFEFTDELVFERDTPREQAVIVKDERLAEVDSTPRIDAIIQNTDIIPVNDIMVVVIAYNDAGNAIAVSSTIIDSLAKDEARPIVFTWPHAFADPVSRIEIIPLYDHRER